MKKSLWIAVVFGIVFAFSVGEQAQAQTPTEKLGRGLANTFLGVFEIPNQMINTFRENTGKSIVVKNDATIKALFVGPVKGGREAVRRTAHGLWDTFTFLSPGPGGQEYESRVNPEFITEEYNY